MRRVRSAILILAVALATIGATAQPANAFTWLPKLCVGFTACNNIGMGNAGYQNEYLQSHWGMYGGHNCTNYAAYRLIQHGVPNPNFPAGQGSAYNWANIAGQRGYVTDKNPRIGDIAWFSSTSGVGADGHVAYVESVDLAAGKVRVSEDNWGGDFDWRDYYITDVSGFIHFRPASTQGSDFNGDGKDDIAWYENWNNGSVTVLTSTGSGMAPAGRWITGFGKPDWAAVGDFNGDGKDDIAWYENWNNGSVTVLTSTGSGMAPAGRWITGFGKPDWAAVGDFNGDGKDDIAWYENWNNGSVTVLTSTGSGMAPAGRWITGFGKPDWAAVGDFNGDGKDDIAWYENWNNGSVTVLTSTGSGMAPAGRWITGFGKPDWAAVGDFNGDGKDDIAWYENWNNGSVTVLTSTGSGMAPAGRWITGFGKPDWAAVGDFNGDGKDDIAWYENWNNGSVTVLTSTGSGMAPAGRWITGFGKPDWAPVGDGGLLSPTPTPLVGGSARAGAVLTAYPGTWGPMNVAVEYQWWRDDTALPAAKGATYLVTAADVGHRLSVVARGSRAGYIPVEKRSAPTALVTTYATAVTGAALSTPTWTLPKATLTWTATGAPAGTTLTYDVQYRSVTLSTTGTRLYSTPTTWYTHTTTKTGTISGTAGGVYQIQARTTDQYGTIGAWSPWTTVTMPIDDRATSFGYTGTWTAGTSTSYYGGTYKLTSTPGAKVTVTAWTDQVSVIGARSTTSGKATITIDGVLKATIDTYSATAAYRQTLATITIPYGKHTITITNQATTGRPRLILDALAFRR